VAWCVADRGRPSRRPGRPGPTRRPRRQPPQQRAWRRDPSDEPGDPETEREGGEGMKGRRVDHCYRKLPQTLDEINHGSESILTRYNDIIRCSPCSRYLQCMFYPSLSFRSLSALVPAVCRDSLSRVARTICSRGHERHTATRACVQECIRPSSRSASSSPTATLASWLTDSIPLSPSAPSGRR
jgi:hypothetical protein